MSDVENNLEMPGSKAGEAAVLFTKAVEEYANGQHNCAIRLFDEVIALCEKCEAQKHAVTRVAAHINLYRVHRALGHDGEAQEHFRKAVSLGASADRLRAY